MYLLTFSCFFLKPPKTRNAVIYRTIMELPGGKSGVCVIITVTNFKRLKKDVRCGRSGFLGSEPQIIAGGSSVGTRTLNVAGGFHLIPTVDG